MLARIVLALASALVCAVTAAAPALGSAPGAYQAVLRVYERQGSVPPCRFSAVQLQSALNGVDTYGAQYFADFTQAIQNALSVRASGSCAGNASATGAGAGAGAGAGSGRPSGPVGPPAHFGPVTAATSAGVPAPLAMMGGLAAVGVLGAVAVATARARRPSPARASGTADPSQEGRI